MKNLVISLIAYKDVNLEWLKTLKKNLDAAIIISFDEPNDLNFTQFCDSYLINESRLGFGKNRRISMILAREFGEYCIITDGDGQFPLDSLKMVMKLLLQDKWDVIIPQRKNRNLKMKYQDKILNRLPFEQFEATCALKILNNNELNSNFDAQPGLYGFKNEITNLILPNDKDWLADFEITLKAIQLTKYRLIDVEINHSVQEITHFSIEDQLKKLKRIATCYKLDLKKIYETNQSLFPHLENELMEKILVKLTKED
ncbi:MAG: hypothetical protein ACTSYC_12815 [Promethearchaeota archaeon]